MTGPQDSSRSALDNTRSTLAWLTRTVAVLLFVGALSASGNSAGAVSLGATTKITPHAQANAASSAPAGTGAVAIKGPSSELIPGVSVEIRANSCTGSAVWRTVTERRPDAYGAFGISLPVGSYCIIVLDAPAPYSAAENQLFIVEQRSDNWFTVWLPGPPPLVTGALVAKDEAGMGVNGVSALVSQGPCGAEGGGVWQNTTATSRWSSGGFGISLPVGTYCATALGVPAGMSLPAATTVEVVAPGPIWITLWTVHTPISGAGNDVIDVNFTSGQRIIEFSCPACSGNTVLWAQGDFPDLLVNTIGPYSGKRLPGVSDYTTRRYTRLAVTANSSWTLRLVDVSAARHGGSTTLGIGDDVVFLDATGSVAMISNHPGRASNLIIWSRTPGGEPDIIVNEIASQTGYWGRHLVSTPSLAEVTARGEWQIDLR